MWAALIGDGGLSCWGAVFFLIHFAYCFHFVIHLYSNSTPNSAFFEFWLLPKEVELEISFRLPKSAQFSFFLRGGEEEKNLIGQNSAKRREFRVKLLWKEAKIQKKRNLELNLSLQLFVSLGLAVRLRSNREELRTANGWLPEMFAGFFELLSFQAGQQWL